MLSSRFKAPLKLDSDEIGEITARGSRDYDSSLVRLRLAPHEITARVYAVCL